MPHPGIIDADLIAAIKATIDAEFGPVPAGLDSSRVEDYRYRLAVCIAKAAQYVRDNAIVNRGQIVAPDTFNVGGSPVVGTGIVDTDGTLS